MNVDANEWTINGGPIHFTWGGVLLGPGVIKHEKLTGRNGPGIEVLACVVCGRRTMRAQTNPPLKIRAMQQLVRPGWTDEHRDLNGRVVFTESEPPAVVGWVTSCGHVVWGGTWELMFPGPGRIPRWVPKQVPPEKVYAALRAAFAVGTDVYYQPQGSSPLWLVPVEVTEE